MRLLKRWTERGVGGIEGFSLLVRFHFRASFFVCLLACCVGKIVLLVYNVPYDLKYSNRWLIFS